MTRPAVRHAGPTSARPLPASNGSFLEAYRKGNANLALALLTACAKGVMLWIWA